MPHVASLLVLAGLQFSLITDWILGTRLLHSEVPPTGLLHLVEKLVDVDLSGMKRDAGLQSL